MSEQSERFRRVAAGFTAKVDGMLEDGWVATNDVFLHTWDLARATGQDERLDPDEVHDLLVGMEPMDEMLHQSGHNGPRVPVPADGSCGARSTPSCCAGRGGHRRPSPATPKPARLR